jgi:hypothetical protein
MNYKLIINKIILDFFKKIYRSFKKKELKIQRFRRHIIQIRKLIPELKINFRHIIEKYNNTYNLSINGANVVYPVWFMWWQGEDQMPDIVKINFKNLKNQLNGNELILITSNSYSKYLQVPDYIIEKFHQGQITLTQFSDLLRVLLLSQKGGLWLDATIYVTKPLPKSFDFYYWTPKWKLSITDYFKFPLWVGLWHNSNIPFLTITQCMGVWFSKPQNNLFLCLSDFWLEYWKNEYKNPYYWTTEVFLIACMYGGIPQIKNLIDEVPLNNKYCFDLANIINTTNEEKELNKFLNDTQFYYLSWKAKYCDIDQNSNKLTLYGKLKDNPNYISNLCANK